MSVVQINGQQIHFTDTGTRPETSNDRTAVVFSHGALLDSTIWLEQLEALAPTHRSIAWDARLHGDTVDDGKEHTEWDSARDLLRLLDSLDVDHAVLVGHSQGGFVSLRAALLDPT
jgi:3-oxoadipate enol-lactonase